MVGVGSACKVRFLAQKNLCVRTGGVSQWLDIICLGRYKAVMELNDYCVQSQGATY